MQVLLSKESPVGKGGEAVQEATVPVTEGTILEMAIPCAKLKKLPEYLMTGADEAGAAGGAGSFIPAISVLISPSGLFESKGDFFVFRQFNDKNNTINANNIFFIKIIFHLPD